MLVIVFKTIHLDTMPRCLGGLYQVRATGSVGTNKLTVPFVKTTNHDLHSFRNASTTVWNRLPEDLRSTILLKEFKFKVRQISFEQI